MSEADKEKHPKDKNTSPAGAPAADSPADGGAAAAPIAGSRPSSTPGGTSEPAAAPGKPSEGRPGEATAKPSGTGTTTSDYPPGSPGGTGNGKRRRGADSGSGRDGGGSGKGLALLALLVGLAGLGAGGYSLVQQSRLADLEQQIDQRVEQRVGAQLNAVQELSRQTRQLSEREREWMPRLERLEQLPSADELDDRARLLGRLQSQQQRLADRVEDVLGESREHWRLAEAEHLLRMAMLRLSAMQDVNSAAALIEEADLILQAQDDPGAYGARRRLLEGLEALRSLPQLDRTGLFLQLGALRGQASRVVEQAPEFQVGEEAAAQPGQRRWQQWLDQLQRYVRVDLDADNDTRPLLAGQSLGQVRLALALAIEQAQWAVLNSNTEVFRQALEQARALLDEQFSEDNEQSRALSQRLAGLSQRQVAVELPDLTPSLRALQAYIEERRQDDDAPQDSAQPEAPAPADGETPEEAADEGVRT
ncbi:uroporphyrinogen-III C-methyltransferase [Stutzerimonas tarimensis]|uniref:Uroporphyrinogen-III C-methyltransferase n=1 Tax=Stutzerimonas tarimensis TaxID=1507735 RepID=A0ABV7T3J6_9GAMM